MGSQEEADPATHGITEQVSVFDTKVVEQSEEIGDTLLYRVAVRIGWRGTGTVSDQINQHQGVILGQCRHERLPGLTTAGKAVDSEEGRPGAGDLDVECDVVDRDLHGCVLCSMPIPHLAPGIRTSLPWGEERNFAQHQPTVNVLPLSGIAGATNHQRATCQYVLH